MVWVTRNKHKGSSTCGHDVFVTAHKPTKRRDGDFENCKLGRPTDFYFKASDFKKIFKFTPRKGSCKLMDLTLKYKE